MLKAAVDRDRLGAILERRKAGFFRSALRTPRRDQISVGSSVLNYERVTSISGEYEAEYLRDATHTLSVDRNVSEVILGDGVFPVASRSRIRKTISGRLGKNRVDLPVEERVHVGGEGTYYFESGGREIKFPFEISSGTVEHYPDRVLARNARSVVGKPIQRSELVDALAERLRPDMKGKIRDLSEETTVREIREIYVPVYEVVLLGPKRRTVTVRIDAVRGKVA